MTDWSAAVARALADPAGPPPPPDAAAALVETAVHHRVLLLLGWRLRDAGALDRWPLVFMDAVRRAERPAVAEDCIRQAELDAVLDALSSDRVRALLFKGAALAHTCYPAPHVRVRADTDVLIPASEVERIDGTFERLGYARPPATSGRLVSYQRQYHRTDAYGVSHAFDVHWKISNLQSLADRFSHAELWEQRVPVPGLGAAALTVAGPSALLLALVHRGGHHPGSRNLLWAFDLHLLANALAAGERAAMVDVALDRGLARMAVDGLTLARDCYGGGAVEALLAMLHGRPWRPDDVPVLGGWPTQAAVLRLDLAALPTWRARARLVREHVLPPASYMRARYGARSSALLPVLYLWRLMHGAPRWLVPRGHGS
jgi:hypothetical protein